jgi:hypothetical protein
MTILSLSRIAAAGEFHTALACHGRGQPHRPHPGDPKPHKLWLLDEMTYIPRQWTVHECLTGFTEAVSS